MRYVVFDDEREFVEEPTDATEVVYAKTTEAFLEAVAMGQPPVDVLVLDYFLAWDTVREGVAEYLQLVKGGMVYAPKRVIIVTSSWSGGKELAEQFDGLSVVLYDTDGRSLGMKHVWS